MASGRKGTFGRKIKPGRGGLNRREACVRALLVYNPNATTTTPAVIDAIVETLSAELKLEVEATKRRGHAGYLAAGAVHEGYDVVIALGGDGTLNEVVQGVARTPVRVAVLPGGHTNVFARMIGLPNNPVRASQDVLRSLSEGRERRISLGVANDRYFVFCAGFGYDAEVVRMVEARPRMKHTLRYATFLWCGLLAKMGGHADRGRVTMHTDGTAPANGLRSVVCCNADPYTFLGPLPARLCPQARLERGLDLTALTSAGYVDLLRIARRALTSNRVAELPEVKTWHDREGYTLSSEHPLALQVDGEFIGHVDRVEMRMAEHALTVVSL